jgi:hypothetical protein
VRAYFTFGIVLSANETSGTGSSATANPFSTSTASPFISFDLDRNWFLGRSSRFNSFFDARLTEIATTSLSTSTSTNPLSTSTSVSSLLMNKQAGSLEAGGYFPLVFTKWDYRDQPYSLFVAPLIKGGFYTSTDTQNPNVTPVNPTDFYKFYGFGARVGHYREHRYWTGELNSSRAPEQLSYMDVVVGRWDNFEYAAPFVNNGTSAAPAPPCNVPATSATTANCFLRLRPWRLGFEGILHVPNTPFILGLSANIAAEHPHGSFLAPSTDLRFLIGVRFDSKTLLAPLAALKPSGQ